MSPRHMPVTPSHNGLIYFNNMIKMLVHARVKLEK